MIKCYRCDALYRPGWWRLVHYPPGTSGTFIVVRELPESDCPICRKPPLLEKPVEWRVAM